MCFRGIEQPQPVTVFYHITYLSVFSQELTFFGKFLGGRVCGENKNTLNTIFSLL
jgi:hypothetical protein